jgi:hypothetical protein
MLDQKVADRNNDEQYRDNCQQIDLPGVVAAGLEFRAHRQCPHEEDIEPTREEASGSRVTTPFRMMQRSVAVTPH